MNLFNISEEEIKKSLQDFSEGNYFPLFRLALTSISNQKEILANPEFVLNVFKKIKNDEDKNHFVDLLIEHKIDFGQGYIENNSSNLHSFKGYWKLKELNSIPLFFLIIPHLNDDQTAKIIESNCINELNNHPQINSFTKALIRHFFEKGHSKSILELLKLKEKKYINFDLTLLEEVEKKFFDKERTLKEYLYLDTLKNPTLLYPYCRLTDDKLVNISKKWLKYHLDRNRTNYGIINKFIKTTFKQLNKQEQESVIPYMLYGTEDLSLLNTALKEYGCEDIISYKPQKYPLWIKAEKHKNKKIYNFFLENNTDIFDFCKENNKTFVEVMVNGLKFIELTVKKEKILRKIFESQRIDYRTFISRLFEERIDEDGQKFNNFSLLVNSKSWIIIDAINLKIEDLEHYSIKFKPYRYEKLSLKDKIELMNDVVDKTFLAKCYLPKNIYLSEYVKEKEINFNLYMSKIFTFNKGIHIIDKHLSLLEQIDFDQYDYRTKYFKIVKQMFDFDSTFKININSDIYKTYVKIIDYVGTDRSLDWKSVKTYLEQEKFIVNQDSFSEGGLHLYKYLYKTALSNTLKQSDKIEIKKFKI